MSQPHIPHPNLQKKNVLEWTLPLSGDFKADEYPL